MMVLSVSFIFVPLPGMIGGQPSRRWRGDLYVGPRLCVQWRWPYFWLHDLVVTQMRFVSIAELKNKASEVLREVGEGENVIVTRHGKPAAVLISVSEDDFEDWAIELNPRLRHELDAAYAECLAGAGRPAEEVLRELQGGSSGSPARMRSTRESRKGSG
jgi:prevent-host-death family protein